MRPRRLVPAAISTLLVLGTQGLASGQDSSRVEWRPLADANGHEMSDDAAQGLVGLKGRAYGARPFSSWSVEAAAPDGAPYPGFGRLCENAFKSETSAGIHCSWETGRYSADGSAGPPSHNGTYAVRVWGREDGGQEQRLGADRLVGLENPPGAPDGVGLAFDDASSQATLSWHPNPEPDIANYVVEQRVGSKPWAEVARPEESPYSATVTEPGTYRYRVAAVRLGALPGRTVGGPASLPGSKPKSFTVTKREPSQSEPSAGPGKQGPDGPESGHDKAAEPGSDAGEPPATSQESGAPAFASSGRTGFEVLAQGGNGPTLRPHRSAIAPSRTPTARPRPAAAPDSGFAPTLPYRQPTSPSGDGAPNAEASTFGAQRPHEEAAAAETPASVRRRPPRWAAGLTLVALAAGLSLLFVPRSRSSARSRSKRFALSLRRPRRRPRRRIRRRMKKHAGLS